MTPATVAVVRSLPPRSADVRVRGRVFNMTVTAFRLVERMQTVGKATFT
jgi:hypothetical protein